MFNIFRKSKNKRWGFRRLTIQKGGFLDWQTNFILVCDIRKIVLGDNKHISHSNQLRETSLVLCTKRRELIFQFNNTHRRDSYLSYLLSYLALSPNDNIRRVPENLQEVIHSFPIGHQSLTIILKECKTPQSIDSIRLSFASTRELEVMGHTFEAVTDENGNIIEEADNDKKLLYPIIGPILSRSKSEAQVDRNSKEEKQSLLQVPRTGKNKVKPISASQSPQPSVSN